MSRYNFKRVKGNPSLNMGEHTSLQLQTHGDMRNYFKVDRLLSHGLNKQQLLQYMSKPSLIGDQGESRMH